MELKIQSNDEMLLKAVAKFADKQFQKRTLASGSISLDDEPLLIEWLSNR